MREGWRNNSGSSRGVTDFPLAGRPRYKDARPSSPRPSAPSPAHYTPRKKKTMFRSYSLNAYLGSDSPWSSENRRDGDALLRAQTIINAVEAAGLLGPSNLPTPAVARPPPPTDATPPMPATQTAPILAPKQALMLGARSFR